jgi:CheY-like chemotaxis protein
MIPVLILSVMDLAQSGERLAGFKLRRVYHTLKPVSRQQLSEVLVEIFTPAAPPAPVTMSVAANSSNGHSPSAALVMLVEDNEANINTLSDYLFAKGYRLHVARSGEQALLSLHEIKPDVILMDVQMPEMDGLEVIRQIRSKQPTNAVPIIALTALAMPGDRERILRAGANDYISKPLSLKRVVDLLEKYTQYTQQRG